MNRRFFSGRWLVLALMTLSVAWGAGIERGPATGEMAPEFALPKLGGGTVELKTLWERGPVVLVVLRGYPGYQCPLCTRQVNEFVGRAKEFAAKGVTVALVYPGPAAELETRAREFLANKEWPGEFVLLLDRDYAFVNAYRLRWDAPKETAYPSTFVIGRGGDVVWRKVSASHGGRTTAAEVLQQLP